MKEFKEQERQKRKIGISIENNFLMFFRMRCTYVFIVIWWPMDPLVVVFDLGKFRSLTYELSWSRFRE